MRKVAYSAALLAFLATSASSYAKGPANFDIRAGAATRDGRQVTAAAPRLGAAVASLDAQRGAPSLLWAVGPQPALTVVDPGDAARAHLARLATLYRLTPAALDSAEVVAVHDSGRGGIVVTLRQRLGGLEVYGSDARVLMTRNLELVAISGGLHPAATPLGKPGSRTFALPATAALATAFGDLTGATIAPSALLSLKTASGAGGYERFALAAAAAKSSGRVFSDPARAKAVYHALPSGIVPAWLIELYVGEPTSAESDYYRYVIAADDGRLLARENLTAYDAFDYRVWADASGSFTPLDGPQADYTPHPTGTPDGSVPAYIAPVLVSMEAFNGPADPWLAASATETNGNNVDAYTDHSGPDGYSPGDLRAVTTSLQTFDYVYDTALEPLATQEQMLGATTQLFYVNNWLHDWFYDSGFDEAAGNAQLDNFGRGGEEGDPLHAEAQDGALSGSRNNANMSTPADGASPRMQMYLWTGPDTRSLDVQPLNLSLVTGRSDFGPQSFDVTADLVLADDGTGTSTDACEPLVNNVSGRIVLIDRGICTFVLKTQNAEAAGALGVVIANNIPGDAPFTMTGNPDPGIPAMMISFEDGADLKTELGNGTLTVHMQRDLQVERDGTIDNMIIAHEWGHYLHHRLIRGGTQQVGAVSEGWGDFVALYMALRQGDDLGGTFAAATYSTANMGDAGYYGIRRYPYSIDQTKNGLSFRHISDGEALPQVDTNPKGASNSEVHNAGEIWASMLFEGYVALLQQTQLPNPPYDFAEAQRRMADYVVAGLKLTPNDATFTEARDGILAAAVASDLDDAVLLAQAFAQRGAGSCAESPPRFSNDLVGVVESFVVAPKVDVGTIGVSDGQPSCDSDGYLDGGESGQVLVQVHNGGFGTLSGAQVTVTSNTAGVSFPNGNTVTVPDIVLLSSGVAAIDIALDDTFTDVSILDLDVGVTAADACVATTSAQASALIHADELLASATVETVESSTEVWSKTGDVVSDEVWERLALAADDHVWHGLDFGSISDTQLESPDLLVSATDPFIVTFDHVHDFEVSNNTLWDGGVIEISEDGGGSWTDVSNWIDPGYTGQLTNQASNPLSDQLAYAGQNASYPDPDTVTLDFGTVFAGQTVRLRFRIGTDEAVGAEGWFIDNIAFSGIDNTPFGEIVAHQGICPEPPVADAGPDQTVYGGDQVLLDASGSYDPDGEPLTFVWSQTGGSPTVALTPDPTGTAGFVAPVLDQDVTLTFLVQVTAAGDTATDEVDILVLTESGSGGGGTGGGGTGGSGAGATGGGSTTGGHGGAGGEEIPPLQLEDGSCGCTVVGERRQPTWGWLGSLALLGATIGRRRRR